MIEESQVSITFRKSCDVSPADLAGKITAVLEESEDRESYKFTGPCPRITYLSYKTSSDSQIEVKSTASGIESVRVISGPNPFVPEQSAETHVDTEEIIEELENPCAEEGAELAEVIDTASFKFEYIIEVTHIEELKDAWDILDATLEGRWDDYENGTGDFGYRVMVGVCQEGVISLYDYQIKKCILSVEVVDSCCKDQFTFNGYMPPPLSAPNVTLTPGKEQVIKAGGCPPLSWGITEKYYGKGKVELKNFDEDTFATALASTDACGRVQYSVADACGSSDTGWFILPCCTEGQQLQVTQLGGMLCTQEAPRVLMASGVAPFTWTLRQGGGTLSDQVDDEGWGSTIVYTPVDGDCGEIIIEVNDSCPSTSTFSKGHCADIDQFEILCCPPPVELAIDVEGSVSILSENESGVVQVIGGSIDPAHPATWTVSGFNVQFQNGETTLVSGERHQTVSFLQDACGAATVTITDHCGTTVSHTIFGTSGSWVYIGTCNNGSYCHSVYNWGTWQTPAPEVFVDDKKHILHVPYDCRCSTFDHLAKGCWPELLAEGDYGLTCAWWANSWSYDCCHDDLCRLCVQQRLEYEWRCG